MRIIISTVILTLALAGCSNAEQDAKKSDTTKEPVTVSQQEDNWEVSPSFKSNDREMRGIQGKIGILGPSFIAGKVDKFMWHFWGDRRVFDSRKVKIVAVNKRTGEKVQTLIQDAGTSNERKVWEYDGLGGPNNGADAHMPSNMSLPSSGVWRLNVYIGEEFFGSVIVEVQ
ncbi:DUF4871 domain-containing protein [Effusibacillus consociatus]|uniref:DUF4871 domain-containing protein n=1 Tax=Effusibacillus consociatus TaxID=1117041 RepID=A0ABV9PWK3_9BACL